MRKFEIPAFSAGVAAKAIRREAAIAAVLELLGEGRKTTQMLVKELGLSQSAMFTYLRHMSQDLQLIRKSGGFDIVTRAPFWELGSEADRPPKEEKEDPRHAPRRKIAPAEQIGMHRDSLVAALFGPAHQ